MDGDQPGSDADSASPGPPASQAELSQLFAQATQRHESRQFAEAESLYRRVLAAAPGHAESLHRLGLIGYQTGRYDAALDLIGRAIAINPAVAIYHCNLGNALLARGEFDASIAASRRSLSLDPRLALAHVTLGSALKQTGQLDAAAASFERAAKANPNYAEAHYNLGIVREAQNRLDDAEVCYGRALALRPNQREILNNLGNVLKERGQIAAAVARYRQALATSPDDAGAHVNLGAALMAQGRLDEAVSSFERALALNPKLTEARDSLLLCLTYSERSPREIFTAHRRFAEVFEAGLPAPAPHLNDRDPGRRLRIGYVSPDFFLHATSFFLRPLLAAHNPANVEVYGYAEVARPDAVTQDFKGLADHWLDTVGMSDADLAERIRADGIDILVDVAGHTAGNRLLTFVRKPAPVQVSWLGYPNTTGLTRMDYKLVDEITDPQGEADTVASETLWRLAGGLLCYQPSPEWAEPSPPPSLANGFVTFGSFNNPTKLGEATLDTWARLLQRVPDSRLVLMGRPFGDATGRDFFHQRFSARGVSPDRVELRGRSANAPAQYGRMDIALDPFPYNGTTTTCEALWMGTPVIALLGDRQAGRVSASLLTRVGLEALIAQDPNAYVEIAAGLAADPRRLAEIRRELRPRMAASPLCDAPAFAREIEAAYRQMWAKWCAAGA